MTVTLRAMTAADLPQALALSNQLAWPYRLEDWQRSFAMGRGLVAADQAGAVVGTALWWGYGPDFAMLGAIIVAPECQGRGIGKRLLGALLDEAGARTLQLNATPDGRPLYEAFGFRTVGGLRQHQGEVRFRGAPPAEVRLAAEGDWPAVAALDRQATGLPRQALLESLRRQGGAALLERDGRALGYAACHRFGRGQVIGPVIAPGAAEAQALFAFWLSREKGFLRADLPREEEALSRWLAAQGLPPVDGATTMRRGEAPPAEGGPRLFAVAAQSWG